jgi:hypothetical protein
VDAEGEYGLHGPHSNTAATIESVIQPDPHAGKMEISIVGRVRYGGFYGPNVELRRRISSTLGENLIRVEDEFFNAGNTDCPHAWLLHINLGYPLVDEGAELRVDEQRVEPHPENPANARHFAAGGPWKRIMAPTAEHNGPTSFVGYIYPKADAAGRATVAIVNPKIGLGVAVRYNASEFGRCVNWQHWGKYEYVTALEPSTGSVEGREKDRAGGLLQRLAPGQRKSYRYEIEVMRV